MEHFEKAHDTRLEIKFTRMTCFLFYLAKALRLDSFYLYLLYNKYKQDLIYVFFMLAGRKIVMPSTERLMYFFKNSDDIYDKLTYKPEKIITKKKDSEIYSELIKLLEDDNIVIKP